MATADISASKMISRQYRIGRYRYRYICLVFSICDRSCMFWVLYISHLVQRYDPRRIVTGAEGLSSQAIKWRKLSEPSLDICIHEHHGNGTVGKLFILFYVLLVCRFVRHTYIGTSVTRRGGVCFAFLSNTYQLLSFSI